MKCAVRLLLSLQLLLLSLWHDGQRLASGMHVGGILQPPVNEEAMMAGIAQLLLHEYSEQPDNLWVNARGLTLPSDRHLWDVAAELLLRIAGMPVQVGHCFCKNAERYYNMQLRIFFVDSTHSFSVLVQQRLLKTIRSDNVSYLVVLVAQPPWRERLYMSQIFRIMFEMFMLNINIVVASRQAATALELYTYFPYSPDDCQSSTPVLIYKQRVNDDVVPTFSSLYLNKMRNMHGCALTAMLLHRPPFVELRPQRSGFDAISGTDGELLKQIGQRLNFTIQLVPANPAELSRVYPNGTMVGVYKSLAEQQVNLTLGDFSYSPHRMKYFTLSKPYYQSNVRILIQSADSYSPLEVLFYPYESNAWCLLIGGYMTRWLALKMAGRWLSAVLPASLRRLLLGMWILSLFEVRCAYEGSYFKFMQQRPLKPSPATFGDLRKLNYVIFCGYTGLNFEYVVKSQGFRYVLSENSSIDQQFNYPAGHYGILLKEEYWAPFMHSHPSEGRAMHFLKESLVLDFHCIYFTRDSHLIEGIDELLILYQNAGLMSKLVTDFVVTPSMHARPQQRAADVGRMLSLAHLMGVFQLLSVMWLIATIIFVVELLSQRFQRLHWLCDRL